MDVSIQSRGAMLTGRFLAPIGATHAVAVLHGATGVPARFYRPFAEWLAGRGVGCLIYDYRDFGWSGQARGSAATMTDWGVHDQQAARETCTSLAPDLPLWVIGHSLGGMMLPYQRGLDGIARVITVAAGAVHVRDHPWPYQAFARAFWSLGPLVRAQGHLPLRALGLGHDIPAGVYRQWRSWCLSPRFQTDDPALPRTDASALRCPVRMIAVADDALCPSVAVWRLMRAYPMARKTQAVLSPGMLGLPRLGHLHVLGKEGAAGWASVVGPIEGDAYRTAGP